MLYILDYKTLLLLKVWILLKKIFYKLSQELLVLLQSPIKFSWYRDFLKLVQEKLCVEYFAK